MHASAFPIGEFSFTGSGSLGSPIYSLQKDVLQFMSREAWTQTLTVTGITSFASQVAIEFVNRQSNVSEERHKIRVSKDLSSQPVPLHPFTSWRSVMDEIAQADVKDLLRTFPLSSFRDKGPNSPSLSLTPGPADISVMCGKGHHCFMKGYSSFKPLEQNLKEEHSVECPCPSSEGKIYSWL